MEELVKKLYDNPNKFNYEVVKEIRKNKGKINNYLLEELDKNIINYNDKKFSIFVDYALFILAEFKEKKAFPLILKLLSIANIEGYEVLGEGTMEKLPSIIVSVFDGNFKALNTIIENKNIDYNIRNALLETYIYFYNNKLINKEELIKYLRKIISLYEYNDAIYDAVLTIVINARLIEMISDVREMFKNNAIDYFVRGGYTEFIDYLFDYEDNLDEFDVITNIEDNMSWWYCFKKDKKSEKTNDAQFNKKLKKIIQNELKENVVDYSKVGRNDPCPCGSGKKFKKCCLNKVEKSLPYQKYIDKALNHYPKKNNKEGEIDFYSIYDEDAIKIDKLLYNALKEKSIPMFINRDFLKEHKHDLAYLDEAYPLIKEIVKNRKIKSIDEYDNKISIHFSLYTFFKHYTDLMLEMIDNKNIFYLEKLKEIINYFYTTFKVDEKWEYLYLDRIYYYYLFTKNYKEAIDFFESKLNNNYTKYETYNYLYKLYLKFYEYDDYLQKMDNLIDKEPNEELKDELINMKLAYFDEENDYNW